MRSKINWPEVKDFAFTVFDDSDNSTIGNVPAEYEFLKGYGFRTTKSLWPLRGNEEPRNGKLLERRWLLHKIKIGAT
jgi:hypothetical protein